VTVSIRAPRISWVWLLVYAPFELAFAVSYWLMDSFFFALTWLVLACISVTLAMWLRTMGVDLTPESAVVRGFRRRSVPWPQVQAVLPHRRQGAWSVRLILESGKPITLRAPTSGLGFGQSQYERDLHRIGQWWLDHRGDSWRPVRPEAPALPLQT
jgi:hypothetical protein